MADAAAFEGYCGVPKIGLSDVCDERAVYYNDKLTTASAQPRP